MTETEKTETESEENRRDLSVLFRPKLIQEAVNFLVSGNTATDLAYMLIEKMSTLELVALCDEIDSQFREADTPLDEDEDKDEVE